jgi:photosystem II stability/assembly factor-like uncharacterized protein
VLRRRRAALLIVTVLLLTVTALIAPFADLPPASPAMAADWQPTGLTEQTYNLYTPASGAFFARTATAVMRSDDGGTTWRQVTLPAEAAGQRFAPSVAVDPNDHTRLYVGNWASRDDDATWTRLDPSVGNPDSGVIPVASGADSSLVYVAILGGMDSTAVRLRRSRDGGSTWDTILELSRSDFRPGAGIVVPVFAAHPTDPNVVFQSIMGATGHGNQGVLRRSDDQGQTFKEVLFSAVRVPRRIVGGRGSVPGRFYATLSSDEVASAVFKSDDGGVTWTETSPTGELAPHAMIDGLAYDPTAPDRVWVAPTYGSVRASENGGTTWTEISPSDWEVSDLALGVDGANLYAATKNGVFRLPLR